MTGNRQSTTRRALTIGAALVAVAAVGAAILVAERSGGGDAERWALVEAYCTDCHNRVDYTAELSLEELGPDSIATHPALFEAVVRKLHGRMMPPPGGPVPSNEEYDAFVAWLEARLDERAAGRAEPGEVVLHRLNRTEYENSIRDLLALDVDVRELLPKDDVSDGFDNIANVLKVSPSFVDQYIAAAREVSERAIGNLDVRPDSRVYYAPATLNQNYHVDGMPLGTRGGLLVEHDFPVDGEYRVSVGGLARARYVEGMEYRHRLIVTVDGVRQFEGELGGPEDMEAIDLRQAVAVGEIDSRFQDIPIQVDAGPHRVAVTFVARTMSEMDTVLEPLVPGGGEVGIVEGEPSPLKVQRVEIEGPVAVAGLSETPSRARIFQCYPETAAEELPCAERILTRIATRAYRRPVAAEDLEMPLRFYRDAREREGFEAGMRAALTMVLASPDFLFRLERAPDGAAPGDVYALDDYSLASRLSFFLWSSVPDEALLDLAAEGRLHEDDVLRGQVVRMLADPKARSLVTNFAFQWLDIRGVSDIVADPVVFPNFDYDLGQDFETELELFLASVLLEDRSVLDLLDARHTFVNERVALHYGIADVRGDQFRRVELDDPNRYGLFGKGGILMATSYPNRTAPVLRGAWILETITGTPPASPPPDVEAFPETQEGEQPKTVRERLEAHRENPSCNGCHGVMDPLGFALENFDAVGGWRERDRDAGEAIDSSGRLADGTVVDGPVDLREALLARPEQFVATLTEKLMTFALSRTLEYYDMPAVRGIVHAAADDDYRFSSLLAGIVASDAFRMARVPRNSETSAVESDAETIAAATTAIDFGVAHDAASATVAAARR